MLLTLGDNFYRDIQLSRGFNNPAELVDIKYTFNGCPVKCVLSVLKPNDISELTSFADMILHPNELSYISGNISGRRKTEYLAGRIAAKNALGLFINEVNPKNIEIARGIFNQPIVRHSSEDIPEISISHKQSMAVALACQSGHCLGIDIEEYYEHNLGTLEGQLSEAEKQVISQSVDYQLVCSQLWSIKEALSKVLKTGLTAPFEIYETAGITFTGSTISQCYFKRFYQYQAMSWVFNQYVLAIVFPRHSNLMLNTDQFSLHITS